MRARICGVGGHRHNGALLINEFSSEEGDVPAAPRHPAPARMPGIAGLAPLPVVCA